MDIRTRRTRAAFRDALIACMKDKAFIDITVSEITKMVGMDRTTFYKHYKSISEILREMEQEQLEQFSALLSSKRKSGTALLGTILKSIDCAEKLYGVAFGGMLPESFKAGVVATAKQFGFEDWRKKVPGLDEKDADLAYEAILAGSLQAALTASRKSDRERVINTIMDMVDSYFRTHS